MRIFMVLGLCALVGGCGLIARKELQERQFKRADPAFSKRGDKTSASAVAILVVIVALYGHAAAVRIGRAARRIWIPSAVRVVDAIRRKLVAVSATGVGG
jgi:hypothetical protein